MKICTKKDCIHKGEPQEKSNFYNDKTREDGLFPQCKDCVRIYGKKYNKKNKVKRKIYSKNYRENLSLEKKETEKKRKAKWFQDNKERIKEERVDYMKEYNKKFYQENKEQEKERSLIYNQTKKAKELHIKRTKAFVKQNPKKVKAQCKLRNAVAKGKIIKPKICSICKQENEIIHGHHEDYNKPLEVIWCCPQCHADIHRALKIVKEGEGYES